MGRIKRLRKKDKRYKEIARLRENETMYVKHISDVEQKDTSKEGAKNTLIQWLINDKIGAKNFVMRRFVVKRNGYTPLHSHDWEHEVYVLSGKGIVKIDKEEYPLEKDKFAYVPPNVVHQFNNTSDENLVLLCVIPLKK